VSPLALGAITFGAGRRALGRGRGDCARDLRVHVEADGNFADTADVYSGGESETMLVRFIVEHCNRDRVVIAIKAGFPRTQGTPLAGGNSARNIRDGMGGSARRPANTTKLITGLVTRWGSRSCSTPCAIETPPPAKSTIIATRQVQKYISPP
jgi:aryl-alcohol dehydrogenase-like predicted oxidoreductase